MINISNGKIEPRCQFCRSERAQQTMQGHYICANCYRQYSTPTLHEVGDALIKALDEAKE